MATRTTYTSTVKVPVYGGWKCSNCGEKCFSAGAIAYRRDVSTSALSSSKREDAKVEANRLAREGWQQNAMGIIFDKKDHAKNLRDDLSFQKIKCERCGKKPKWTRGSKLKSIVYVPCFLAIMSGLAAISVKKSLPAWLIFAACLGVTVYCIVMDKVYIRAVGNMPDEELPVIGSQNGELLLLAEREGKRMPSPDDVTQTVNNY